MATNNNNKTKPEKKRAFNLEDGNKLRHVREVLNMNQSEFADTLDISQAALSYLESGETTMSFPVFKNLIQVHNVNPYFFIGGAANEPVFLASKKQSQMEKELKNKIVKMGELANTIVQASHKMLQHI